MGPAALVYQDSALAPTELPTQGYPPAFQKNLQVVTHTQIVDNLVSSANRV